MRNEATRNPKTPEPAKTAKAANQNGPGLLTLIDLCRDLAVDPATPKARVSVGELADILAAGDVPPALVDRFAVAVGKAHKP
jgi:hypothetical protein